MHNSSEMSQCWVMYLNLAGRSERCAEVGWGGERKERRGKKRKKPWLSLNGRWPTLNVRSETNSILRLRLGLMNWQTLLGARDGAPARGDGRLWHKSYTGGGLNSRLSLSAELASFFVLHTSYVMEAREKNASFLRWGEIQCQQVKYEAVSEILWKVSACDRSSRPSGLPTAADFSITVMSLSTQRNLDGHDKCLYPDLWLLHLICGSIFDVHVLQHEPWQPRKMRPL